MASILKVDTIQDQSGNNIINESADTITIGASGDTVTVPTGATLTVPNGGLSGQNYPAFEANRTSIFLLPNTTITKVQFDNEVFDTNGYYDNATNYRFTPLVAGKYMVYSTMSISENNSTTLNAGYGYIYKNGSLHSAQYVAYLNNPGQIAGITLNSVVEFNGTTDYVEIFAYMNSTSHTGVSEGVLETSNFGAYRIGA